jgi:hypothetical protein
MKSRGIGDTIEKIMKATGVKNLVETLSGKLGIDDCGCEARREALNRMLPYKNNQDDKLHNTDESVVGNQI